MNKILLVNPHETEQMGFTNPPIGLLYIAGTLLRHGFDVRVVDGCLEGNEAVRRSIREFRPEMVGITCLTPGRKRAIEVARMAKEHDPGTTVVLGGAHATIMYRQILEHYPCIDIVAMGEGEITCLEIAMGKPAGEIRGIAHRGPSGEAVKNPARPPVANLDDLPFPAWHLLDLGKYPARNDSNFRTVNGVRLDREPRISVVFSRGCPGHCTFCSTWWIWKGWRRRSARNMADEIELLYREFGIRHICFADDAMTADREAVSELCDEIVRRGLRIAFGCTTRSDCLDEPLLEKLKRAGCYTIAIGVESASPSILATMKKANEVQAAERAIALAKKHGIFVTALLIVGNVGETDETVRETVAFIKRSRPSGIGLAGSLWIFPGTKLYQDCKRAGFIDDDFWLSDEPYKIYTMEHDLKTLRRYSRMLLWHGVGPKRLAIDKWKNLLNSLRRHPAKAG